MGPETYPGFPVEQRFMLEAMQDALQGLEKIEREHEEKDIKKKILETEDFGEQIKLWQEYRRPYAVKEAQKKARSLLNMEVLFRKKFIETVGSKTLWAAHIPPTKHIERQATVAADEQTRQSYELKIDMLMWEQEHSGWPDGWGYTLRHGREPLGIEMWELQKFLGGNQRN